MRLIHKKKLRPKILSYCPFKDSEGEDKQQFNTKSLVFTTVYELSANSLWTTPQLTSTTIYQNITML
jgi:hypothetical protein